MSTICTLVSRQFTPSFPIQTLQQDGGSHDQQTAQDVRRASRTASLPHNCRSLQLSDDQLVQTIAERLVEYGMACMKKKTRASPFERAAAREGMYFRGGVRIPLCWFPIQC